MQGKNITVVPAVSQKQSAFGANACVGLHNIDPARNIAIGRIGGNFNEVQRRGER
jgi:hypothetical protein